MANIKNLLKSSPLYGAIILEDYFYTTKRRLIIKIAKYLIISIPVIIILWIILGNYGLIDANSDFADFLIKKLSGIILLAIGLYGLMQIFEAYFASIYYFEYVSKNKYRPEDVYTFSAGRLLLQAENDNLLTGLLRYESYGGKITERLGLSREETNTLLMKQAEIKNPPILKTENIPLLKLSDITNFIYDNHSDFRNLLTNHGLDKKDLQATVSWVVYNIEAREYDRQWWTKEKLAQIPGVASDWSFGRTYLLNKFSRNIFEDKEVNSQAFSYASRTRELEQIQSVLARSAGANVILVGLPGQEKMEVIWNLCRRIKEKTASPELIGKKVCLFLTNDFTTIENNRDDFEDKLSMIFNEALRAGDVILVIDNLPKLIIQAKQYGLNLYEILEPYLASANDQIIALADTEYFHGLIEPDQAIMSLFEIVQVKPLLLDEIVQIVAREVLMVEKIYEILYTYPAILEIARSAEYYFPDGVSADKAKDLLSEISPWAVEKGLDVIGKEEVILYIERKTNIPTSAISSTEKSKLLNLENQLAKRIIAQREAVFSVSNALRRNRAGIRNENRPLGSFLFLGPTGVGKTETAKALADVFFGDEKLLLRLDMSEYQNTESLARLIGSQEKGTQGILCNLLREHPYGVLLLDEFEKTNKEILNLFLQIIDEGYFSDVFGKKVLARNIMFIATSNAGADKIFNIVSNLKTTNDTKNIRLQNYETEIISDIVKQGIFKPELINRFDATILFQPLTKENLTEIAKLMLAKVAKRLGEKGMILEINTDLIRYCAENGYNPAFGARPMNRLIQDTVEQHLADLIIRDELTAGQTVEFSVISNTRNKDDLSPRVK